MGKAREAGGVEVTLIDVTSGTVMGVTRFSPEALPESFFSRTTLHLGDADWSVVSAQPMTRDEYRATGTLVLRLSPIQKLDPAQLLFSLPTICDPLPASEGGAADGSEVVLREDDWRQVELVSSSLRASVEREIAAIRAIHENERVGLGYRNVHVRSALAEPIERGHVARGAWLELVGDPRVLPLRFDGVGQRVSGGFAARFDGERVVYGVESAGGVEILGAYPDFPESEALRAWAREHALVMVDWCRCEVRE